MGSAAAAAQGPDQEVADDGDQRAQGAQVLVRVPERVGVRLQDDPRQLFPVEPPGVAQRAGAVQDRLVDQAKLAPIERVVEVSRQ